MPAAVAVFFLAVFIWPSVGAAKPERIVSINLCADQMLLAMAPRRVIVSLSRLVADREISAATAAEIGSIPLNGGRAEEVLALKPDLVVAGRHAARATIFVLKKLGYRVMEMDIARSIPEIRENIRILGEAIGEPHRAEALIKAIDARLRRLAPVISGTRLGAVYYQPNGLAAGLGSLVDDVISRAGLVNVAARLGVRGQGRLPLEMLIMARPDILIIDAGRPQAPALAFQVLDHPALAALTAKATLAAIPQRLWICGLSATIEVTERLAKLRRLAARRRQ